MVHFEHYYFSPYTDDDQSKSSFSCEGVPAKVDDDMHDDQIKNDIATSLSCSHEFGSTRVLQEVSLNSTETEQRLSDEESTNSDDYQVNNWNDDGKAFMKVWVIFQMSVNMMMMTLTTNQIN